MKNILLLLSILSLNNVFSQTPTTIYTPKGTAVQALIVPEMSAAQIASLNAQVASQYPNAQRMDDASATYNCHGYAWHISEGGSRVWLNTPGDDTYWIDGSYNEVTNTSTYPAKVSYASDDHSAVTTAQADVFISKWGSWPLMKHNKNYTPYNSSVLKYYACLPTSLTVSGASGFCSSATYTVPELPATAAVTWSASPAGIVSLTPNGNSVTANMSTSGSLTLTAGIQNSCGRTTSAAKAITVGNYSPGDYPISGQTSLCANTVTTYSTNSLPNATSYNWIIPANALSNGWSIVSGQGTRVLTVITGSVSTTVRLKVPNNCTTNPDGLAPAMLFVNINSCGALNFSISPNPATNNVTVEPIAPMMASRKSQATHPISQINLYDQQGNLKRQQKFTGNSTREQVNISGLNPGMYFVEIITTNGKEQHTLMIKQ